MLIIDLLKLQEYIDLEDTSLTGYLQSLVSVASFSGPHGMSDEFKLALWAELQYWLKRFETETIIESHEIPQPPRIFKSLVWISEAEVE